MKRYRLYSLRGSLIALLALLFLGACGDFLEQKPAKSIVIPESLDDLQSILNSIDLINSGDSFGLLLSDDLYTTDQGWLGFGENIQRGYLWEKQLSNVDGSMASWSVGYNNIFKFNLVLEQAALLTPQSEEEELQLNRIVGTALFLRSFHYFELLQLFTHPVLDDSDFSRDGIPMPLVADFTEPKGKVSVGEIYDQIIADLNTATTLLPELPSDPLRPSQVASRSMLARVYLQLGAYENALEQVEEALAIKSTLMDFNNIPDLENIPIPLYSYPIPRFNEEVVIQLLAGSQSYMYSDLTYVNQEVYESYDSMDIRKYLYFNEPDEEGRVNFLGSYSGDYLIFSGISTGELFLIQAECQARLDRESEALETLNTLLETRFFTGSFVPLEVGEESVLQCVLSERRKELIYRGITRWNDMRRFLRDPDWQGVLPRTIQGNVYDLGLDPAEYVLEIPLNEQQRNGKL